tara:strand:+ start:29056 stop:29187 length:132 start_codon:yes stop_codon:yes gene_type:complete
MVNSYGFPVWSGSGQNPGIHHSLTILRVHWRKAFEGIKERKLK